MKGKQLLPAVFLLLAACAAAKHGQPSASRPTYEIRRATGPIQVDGVFDEEDWAKAEPVGDFTFNWWESGEKEQTVAKMLWDDRYLYVAFYCYDRHISAYVTERHGPVSHDDCVEVFLSPNPSKVSNYYNFEMNAIGTMLNGCHTDWWTGPLRWDVTGVLLGHSVKGDRKEEDPADESWTMEVAIPLEHFERDAAHVPPKDGDVWRLNLNRCGGVTNPQYSTWSPISAPQPAFHLPEQFGYVAFSEKPVR